MAAIDEKPLRACDRCECPTRLIVTIKERGTSVRRFWTVFGYSELCVRCDRFITKRHDQCAPRVRGRSGPKQAAAPKGDPRPPDCQRCGDSWATHEWLPINGRGEIPSDAIINSGDVLTCIGGRGYYRAMTPDSVEPVEAA